MAKKVKKVKKVKKKSQGRKVGGVLEVTLPGFEKFEGEILNITDEGMFVQRKRPRSSKWDKVFIPAADLVAYAKGAGRKAPDIIIRKTGKAPVLSGRTEAMSVKNGKFTFTIDGVDWVVLQGDIDYQEPVA